MALDLMTTGRTAIISGGATGLGRAAAIKCGSLGMRVCIADIDEKNLVATARLLTDEIGSDNVYHSVVDVADMAAVHKFAQEVSARYDNDVGFLFANAGTGIGSASVLSELDGWRKNFDVNFFGILHFLQAFVPLMLQSEKPGIIVNTGSKQGLTNVPGNPAYNAAKGSIRLITEQLQHELRSKPDCKISAHLFIPGFVNTNLAYNYFRELKGDDFDPEKDVPWSEEKPASGAWNSSQAIDFLFDALQEKPSRFYILCPDNDVTTQMDYKRLRWYLDDILVRDLPLSRWHPDYKDAFAVYMKEEEGGFDR